MMRKPAFWLAFTLLSIGSTAFAYRYFGQAFPIVSLEITMDREAALAAARRVAAEQRLGPSEPLEAASFALDAEAQMFIELEGGGKEVFARLMADGLYSPYTWRVRHFKESETHEVLYQFTPGGRPYGFVERLREDAPGAALAAAEARALGEAAARSAWNVDLDAFTPVEQSDERRPGGRVDHTFVYERPERLNDGRYRLRLTVSGDRLTEVRHFVQIPEAFDRRYEEMRSANEALGIASSVGMLVLYVVGGIGVGLFFLLRQRWVIWRRAVFWGAIVGLFQLAASLNEWPLAWMGYDTALSIQAFTVQRVALIVAAALGMTMLLALSFMAAESLTRRAFPSHPQLWRVWSRDAAASPEVLGRTAAGYLLVGLFFAYEVALYFLSTRVLDWWTPSEALVHPDILATYQPWLAAIAPSLQAGFWEEALFRAVPLAGAALIGDRFGGRRAWIVFAMLLQAAIFGAGHAPYPTQPAYARAVELVLPSIGFGLLYLRFGLLPGIVLHYAFDVAWFALPVFVSTGTSARVSQVLVILFTLVPLWVVIGGRVRRGRWTPLPETLRNAAWTPSAAPEAAPIAVPVAARPGLTPWRVRTVMVAGLVGLVLWGWARPFRSELPSLAIDRRAAAAVARDAVAARGVDLRGDWWVMPTVRTAIPGGPFVWETAGRDRYRELLGSYLDPPHWQVRVARFEGDVVERAEEWTVHVRADGTLERVVHTLPEARAGASLSEDDARARAQAVVRERFGLEGAELESVSAESSRRPERTDWDITFADRRVAALPQGEPRVTVTLAGDEVAAVTRFVHLPEDWQRRQRARETVSFIVQGLSTVVVAGLVIGGAIAAVVSWSRRRFAVRFFLLTLAVFLTAAFVEVFNGFPSFLAGMSTAQPWRLQVVTIGGLGLVGLAILASIFGLVCGGVPRWTTGGPALDRRTALLLGAALGAFAAGVLATVAAVSPADGPVSASYDAAAHLLPALTVAVGQVGNLVSGGATFLLIVAGVDRYTHGWASRRAVAGVGLVVLGLLLGGGTPRDPVTFVAAGVVAGALLLAAYVFVLRSEPSLVPPAVGALGVLSLVRQATGAAFPGAVVGALAGIVVTGAVTWWWFVELRRAREATSVNQPSAV